MAVTNRREHVRQAASAEPASDVAMASVWRTSQNLSAMEMTIVEMEQVPYKYSHKVKSTE